MSTKLTFTLTWDQIDDIVVHSLKSSYRTNSKPDKIDCSDYYLGVDDELLNAIDVVLHYYMTTEQKDEWTKEKKSCSRF